MRRASVSSARLRTKVIAPDIAPCANAGPNAAAPCARLAQNAHAPIARNAKPTCTALARASDARDKLDPGMSAPPLRLTLAGVQLPPIAWPLIWGLAGVLALLT